MSPRLLPRLLAGAATVLAIAIASGCAALSGGTSPAPTSTASVSPTVKATATPPTPSANPASPPEFGEFTEEQLTRICVNKTVSTFNPDVTFDLGGTRIERRTVTPEWLVIVPARTGGLDGRSLCTIGGSPASPVVEMASGSLDELPEAQIQRLIRGENEGTNP